MTQIGRLKPFTPGSLAQFRGELHTLEHRLVIHLQGDESLSDSRHPSHRIYARNKAGVDIEVGSGWLKTVKNGPRAGEQFLSLSIDYPGLPGPMNVAAFCDQGTGEWRIFWRRRGVQTAAASAA